MTRWLRRILMLVSLLLCVAFIHAWLAYRKIDMMYNWEWREDTDLAIVQRRWTLVTGNSDFGVVRGCPDNNTTGRQARQ